MTERHRITDLRRRVQQDPASLAFAQLAEELRRDGNSDEAVAVCRAGLVHHPKLLTARVTLGRALIELNRLAEALDVLTAVLRDAPGNLASLRGLAEIYQRRGSMGDALMHYRRAMELAQGEARPARDAGAGQGPAPPGETSLERKVEALFDFDSLLAQLGGSGHDRSPIPNVPPTHGVVEKVQLPTSEPDELAIVEKQLRDRELRLMLEAQARHLEESRRRVAVQELEQWLTAIVSERRSTEPHC